MRSNARAVSMISRFSVGAALVAAAFVLAWPQSAHASSIIIEPRHLSSARIVDGVISDATNVSIPGGSSALYGTLALGEELDAFEFVAPSDGVLAVTLLMNTRPDASNARITLALLSAEGTRTAGDEVPAALVERFDWTALDLQEGVAYGRFDVVGGQTYILAVQPKTYTGATLPYVMEMESPSDWPSAGRNGPGLTAVKLWLGAYAQRSLRKAPIVVGVALFFVLLVVAYAVAAAAVYARRRRREAPSSEEPALTPTVTFEGGPTWSAPATAEAQEPSPGVSSEPEPETEVPAAPGGRRARKPKAAREPREARKHRAERAAVPGPTAQPSEIAAPHQALEPAPKLPEAPTPEPSPPIAAAEPQAEPAPTPTPGQEAEAVAEPVRPQEERTIAAQEGPHRHRRISGALGRLRERSPDEISVPLEKRIAPYADEEVQRDEGDRPAGD